MKKDTTNRINNEVDIEKNVKEIKIKIYKPKIIVSLAYVITFLLFLIVMFFNPYYFKKEHLYTLILFAMLGIPAHEFLHYITAKILKVRGLGFHFVIHGVVLKYREMERLQCIATSISPFLFFLLLIIITPTLNYNIGVHLFVLSWVAFSSSGFDLLSFIMFLKLRGKKTYPLYDKNNKLIGGIIKNNQYYVLLVKSANEEYIKDYINKNLK